MLRRLSLAFFAGIPLLAQQANPQPTRQKPEARPAEKPKRTPLDDLVAERVQQEFQMRLPRMRQELESQIMQNLRSQLRMDLKQELKSELRQEIKQELKTELRYELKSEIKQELRFELKQ